MPMAKGERKEKNKWVRILLWTFGDLLLVIPILLLLLWFGRLIDQKRDEQQKDEESTRIEILDEEDPYSWIFENKEFYQV